MAGCGNLTMMTMALKVFELIMSWNMGILATEMKKTSAHWHASRSGMHEDIPSRHWHQNDPGVIPNLYITGSGSPTGIIVYEGDLLPEQFHGQLLHCDAGPGAARAYAVQDDGAGFKAQEIPMLMRQNDAWYRPTDVAVAPDGSVFFADWYDPGVGGHWAGDNQRGRVFRVAPQVNAFETPNFDFSTPEGAVEALKNPNAATRYMAFAALQNFGKQAEVALAELWKSGRTIHKARALWLLARIDGKYVENALNEEDELMRSTAIRVARYLYPGNLLELLNGMAKDPSMKVKREMAIALREMEGPDAHRLWAKLATQHNGDRWYLEALGIGAMDKEDDCFNAWLTEVGEKWNTPKGRDIIWRSRTNLTFPYLMQKLAQSNLSAKQQARYLRATDFLDIPNKDQQLASLMNIERKDKAVFQQMLLTHISATYAQRSPVIKAAVQSILPGLVGTRKYLEIVSKLELKAEIPTVFKMAMENPNKEIGVSAAKLVIALEGWNRFEEGIKGSDKKSVIALLTHINQTPGKTILKKVIIDNEEELALRRKAMEALAFDWGWEDRVLDVLENYPLPEELIRLGATKLMGAAQPIDRAKGTKFLDKLGGLTEIASVEELLKREGDASKGKAVFSAHCIACHQINGEGIEFGPALTEIANKLGKEGLYSSILYPNTAISHGYEGHHFEMKNGSHYNGYILSESAEAVELKVQSGISEKLLKTNIAKREEMETSLMTSGLAQVMGEQQLVDLIAYLSTLSNQATMASNPYQGKIKYELEN